MLFLRLWGGRAERTVYNVLLKNNHQNDKVADLKCLTSAQGQYRLYSLSLVLYSGTQNEDTRGKIHSALSKGRTPPEWS